MPNKTLPLQNEQEFLRFAIDSGVLRFGEFTLKSGANSIAIARLNPITAAFAAQ